MHERIGVYEPSNRNIGLPFEGTKSCNPLQPYLEKMSGFNGPPKLFRLKKTPWSSKGVQKSGI